LGEFSIATKGSLLGLALQVNNLANQLLVGCIDDRPGTHGLALRPKGGNDRKRAAQ
jgi:hypothetical protein